MHAPEMHKVRLTENGIKGCGAQKSGKMKPTRENHRATIHAQAIARKGGRIEAAKH